MPQTAISLEKSTTGRAWATTAPLRRALFAALPRISSTLLTRRFLTPWERAAPVDASDARSSLTLSIGDAQVAAHVWGKGPMVILCHGWAGGASQFTAIRQALLAAGFGVAAFDAPAHGGNRRPTSNAGMFTRSIEAVARELGSIHAIVGHSLGGMAAALAHARGVDVQTLVLLAPMPSFDFALDQFQAAVGFDDGVRERVAVRVESLAGVRRDEARLNDLLSDGTPTLMLHDAADGRVPVASSRELARSFNHVELVETSGLGHRRLLHDPDVVARVVQFIAGRPPLASAFDRALCPLPLFDELT